MFNIRIFKRSDKTRIPNFEPLANLNVQRNFVIYSNNQWKEFVDYYENDILPDNDNNDLYVQVYADFDELHFFPSSFHHKQTNSNGNTFISVNMILPVDFAIQIVSDKIYDDAQDEISKSIHLAQLDYDREQAFRMVLWY